MAGEPPKRRMGQIPRRPKGQAQGSVLKGEGKLVPKLYAGIKPLRSRAQLVVELEQREARILALRAQMKIPGPKDNLSQQILDEQRAIITLRALIR